ncbi:hypothetical protein ACOSQ2_030892 [Xanthoceras sorbifolium]
MFEQIENPPTKDTELATSPKEASEDLPKNPPQQQTEEHPKNPEQQPSEEEDDNSDSLRDEQQLNESVDRPKDNKNPRNGIDKNPRIGNDKNARNVPLESDQLEPFLRIWWHEKAGKDSKKMKEEDEKEMRPEMQPVRGADNENPEGGSEQTADEFESSGEEKLMKK